MSQSEFLDRSFHFYALTDGTYRWPNSAEGDLLKIAHQEITQQQKVSKDREKLVIQLRENIEKLLYNQHKLNATHQDLVDPN